jgi:hypothetical protein
MASRENLARCPLSQKKSTHIHARRAITRVLAGPAHWRKDVGGLIDEIGKWDRWRSFGDERLVWGDGYHPNGRLQATCGPRPGEETGMPPVFQFATCVHVWFAIARVSVK